MARHSETPTKIEGQIYQKAASVLFLTALSTSIHKDRRALAVHRQFNIAVQENGTEGGRRQGGGVLADRLTSVVDIAGRSANEIYRSPRRTCVLDFTTLNVFAVFSHSQTERKRNAA
jgi:hypothetical protein